MNKPIITALLLVLAVIPFLNAGEYYRVRLELATYDAENMEPAEAARLFSNPKEFNKLKPSDIIFEQELRVKDQQKVHAEISRGAEQINYECTVVRKASEKARVVINVDYTRILDVANNNLLKSSIAQQSSTDCTFGINTPIFVGPLSRDEATIWSIKISDESKK